MKRTFLAMLFILANLASQEIDGYWKSINAKPDSGVFNELSLQSGKFKLRTHNYLSYYNEEYHGEHSGRYTQDSAYLILLGEKCTSVHFRGMVSTCSVDTSDCTVDAEKIYEIVERRPSYLKLKIKSMSFVYEFERTQEFSVNIDTCYLRDTIPLQNIRFSSKIRHLQSNHKHSYMVNGKKIEAPGNTTSSKLVKAIRD